MPSDTHDRDLPPKDVGPDNSPDRPTPWYKNEDWLSAGAGWAILAGLLFGWRPAAPSLKWKTLPELTSRITAETGWRMLVLSAVVLGLTWLALRPSPGKSTRFLGGFSIILVLAWLAQWIAGNARMEAFGLEYVIFSLGLGLIGGNLLGLGSLTSDAARSEFFVKSGVVILGATILLPELFKAGALGIVQALLVVTVVWWVAWWLARRLRVDEEFGVMLATAVSICGVSAAIAACGAIKGDRRKLSYITSLVLIVAIPMMIAMPWAVKILKIPDVVGGAWLGGTLDTSGSVVAAGTLISESAMKAGVVVKFSQNVLIGFAALALAAWWSARKHSAKLHENRWSHIWERFPKFVLGFIVASAVFSFWVTPGATAALKAPLNSLRNLWFALAFVSIGLETRFKDLWTLDDGRPALAFIGAQAFNVLWTLLLAWLIFGGVIVASPVFK